MARPATNRRTGIDRAALAYSTLPAEFAGAVHECLPTPDRRRLREGLARTREADEGERLQALRELVRAVRAGIVFPRPAAHEEADCPFHRVAKYPMDDVVEILERIATREPMEVAVVLCHLPKDLQHNMWDALKKETRDTLVPLLEDVHGLSGVRTREYSRDLNIRLARLAMRTR